MLTTCLQKLLNQHNLSKKDIYTALPLMLDANHHVQSAALLALLKAKGETAEEIVACVEYVKTQMLSLPACPSCVDIVGTGGDGMHTINISTAAALLAASCAVDVIKHGNRAVSSRCGSADVLAALNIPIDNPADKIMKSLEENHFGFCFAPRFHPVFQALKPLRKQLAIPTIFNVIGPLLNPAQVKHILLGVYDRSLIPVMIDALIQLGYQKGLVFHGQGLDEISCLAPMEMYYLNAGHVQSIQVDPKAYGLPYCTLQDLQGGDIDTNASVLMQIFQNKPHPARATIVLNAGVACFLSGRTQSIAEGVVLAQQSLTQGKVMRLIRQLTKQNEER